MRAHHRFVTFRHAAFKNEIKLMLQFRRFRFLSVDLRDMHQAPDRNLRADFFPALALKCLLECFTRVLSAAGKGEIAAFHRVLFFLNQQGPIPQDEGAGC